MSCTVAATSLQPDELLVGVLQREPLYPPALGRLAELRFCCQGRLADAVQLGQQAWRSIRWRSGRAGVVIRSAVGMRLPQPGRDAARGARADRSADVPMLLSDGRVRDGGGDLRLSRHRDRCDVTDRRDERRRRFAKTCGTRDYARAIEALRAAHASMWMAKATCACRPGRRQGRRRRPRGRHDAGGSAGRRRTTARSGAGGHEV